MKPTHCRLGCQGTHEAEHELRRDLNGSANALANLEARYDALRAENARLREALEAILNGIAVVNGMRVLRPDSPTSAEIRAALTR